MLCSGQHIAARKWSLAKSPRMHWASFFVFSSASARALRPLARAQELGKASSIFFFGLCTRLAYQHRFAMRIEILQLLSIEDHVAKRAPATARSAVEAHVFMTAAELCARGADDVCLA